METGLAPWSVLLCIASSAVHEITKLDGSDMMHVRFNMSASPLLSDRLLSLNELDADLHAYALEVLDARAAAARAWLEANPAWLGHAVRWRNERPLPLELVHTA